jgi:hypothetical protein
MGNLELERAAIDKNTRILKELDYNNASIKEVEDLLMPLFKGYTINAPSFEPGLNLYRSRICNKSKPIYLHELSYPRTKYVKGYGRANDVGQSMFYGSISKDIPFFELGAIVGDKLVMTIWRTKAKLLLNHIGYSEEVFSALKSNRDANSLYQFISDTKNFNNLNTFVYNYLAAAFSRKILPVENHLYKLSIAITNKLLMGDLLQGVLYPTIAMNGNSDNIVLKPSYVDKHMEFISVQYLEVAEHEGMKYRYNVLDSATEIINGEIRWSGKLLGWNIESQKSLAFGSDGSDWSAKDEQGIGFDPKPTTEIRHDLTILESRYINSFPEAFKISIDVPVSSLQETLVAKCTLLLDFDKRCRSLSFYIPECKNQSNVIEALIQKSDSFLSRDIGQVIELRDQVSGELICTDKDLLFSRDIYIFSESYIELKELPTFPGLNIHIIHNA